MSRIYVDIETYSSVDLPKTGVYRYVESDDFRILMAAWSINGGKVWVDTDQKIIAQRIWEYLEDPDETVLVAHNAAFERVCFSRLLGFPAGSYLDPERWHDTQAVASEYGYPKKLENLANVLDGEKKDSAGTRLINLFSKPNRKGERTLPEEKPEEWQQFIDYCAQDVVTLVDIDRRLGDFPTEVERQLFFTDQKINDRGIRIDVGLATKAVEAAEENRMVQELRVTELTGVLNPGSQPQMLKWAQTAVSPRIKDLQKATVEKILRSPKLTDTHREVFELRQELALVASKKYASALNSVCSDGRLRGTLGFFGAHTGRWSGRGTQVQNLPREAFVDEDGEHDQLAEDSAILDLMMGMGASSLDLKKLVRSLFYVDGCVVDYSAIEARVIAWLAGEQWPLDAFKAGRDIYVETAERMSTDHTPLDRSQGKVAVLALGFGGGIRSLRVMGAEGSDQDLKFLVDQWRRTNPNTVRLWRLLGDALADAGPEPMPVGQHLAVSRQEDDTVRLHLPSGRAITYHNMTWDRYRVQDPETGRWGIKTGWRYDDPKRPGGRIGTYGGRMAENATQATARDLLGWALILLENAGYRTVAHVHDEAVVEGARNWRQVRDIMCQTPDWAKGLPVDGDGFTTTRYKKG